MSTATGKQIACPRCSERIDVNELLLHQVEDEVRRKFEGQAAELARQKSDLERRAATMTADLEAAVKAKLAAEKSKLEHAIREESVEQVKALQAELEKKSQQVKELNKAKVEIERLQREKDELKDDLEAQAQRKITEALKAEKEKNQKALEQLEQAAQAKLAAEKKQWEAAIRAESGQQVQALQKELEEKTLQVKEINKAKAEVARLQREKDELKDVLEAQAQQTITETLKQEKEKIRKAVEEREAMKLGERDRLIEQLTEQLKEAQRKAEQGSQQLQGEVQELAIEQWLAAMFPLDSIEEVKKGARGADCLHVVNTRERPNCGRIYYESKRTKDFQAGWIEKFKVDMRAMGAHVGVLVTEAMPKGMDRMGLRDGVWVCGFEEFKGLCAVLRESVIQLSTVAAAQENKGDKMVMLYDFLTSNEFRGQVEAIVEGFTQMQADLKSERRTFENAWKKREKQLEKVLLNTTHMYASIRGIAGNAVPAVALLEHDGVATIGPKPSSVALPEN